MKVFLKALSDVLLALALPIVIIGVLIATNDVYDYDLDHYRAMERYTEPLKPLDQLGEYESVSFMGYTEAGLSYYESVILCVHYDPSEYLRQRQAILDTTEFEQEPIYDRLADKEGFQTYKNPCFELDGYSFQLCKIEYLYPKDLGFIGFNDTLHNIVFVQFSDSGIDYIAGDFTEILDECKWEKRDEPL